MDKVLRDLGALFYIVPLQAETGTYSSPSDVPDYVERAIPYFLLLIVLEFIYSLKRKHKLYSLKDVLMSLSLGIVQQLLGVWMKEALIFPYIFIASLFAPLRQQILSSPYWPDMSSSQYDILIFIVGFLGCDLGYYFLHRTAHEWQLLWSAHSVHHSGERYNFATALRQGSFQSTYSWFFYMPLAAMGLPVTHFIRHNRLNTVYQFWIHTEIVGRCPWLVELIMNTASHHRLHHRPPGNCNYAGVLIIWDRLFCTFQSERHLTPTKITTPSKDGNKESTELARGVIYGLARPLNNYDPVYANMCHLLRLCEPKKTADGNDEADGTDGSWFVTRLVRFLSVVVTKRIQQRLRVTLSVDELMPDVLEDWRIAERAIPRIMQEEDCPYPIAYATHLWREMWAMPPPVDESALQVDGAEDVAAGKVGTVDGAVAEFSHRDMLFLKGRKARESPPLSWGMAFIVTAQFLLALVVGYSVLLYTGNDKDSLESQECATGGVNFTSSGDVGEAAVATPGMPGDTARTCMAMVCIGCVLLLQTIKLYYRQVLYIL